MNGNYYGSTAVRTKPKTRRLLILPILVVIFILFLVHTASQVDLTSVRIGLSTDMNSYIQSDVRSLKKRDCLNEDGKKLYDGIYSSLNNFEDFKCVDFKLNEDNTSESDRSKIVKCLYNIYEYYVLPDNPDIFWVNDGVSPLYESEFIGESYTLRFNYQCSPTEKEEFEKIINEKVMEVVSSCTETDKYEQVRYYHDWLINNIEYVDKPYFEPDGDEKNKLNNSTYDLFQNKSGLCRSYAYAFSLFMKEIGVESTVVIGTGKKEHHAWNIIKLDDGYYNVDVTWDNPEYTKGKLKLSDKLNHTSFCITDEELLKIRKPDDYQQLPQCNATKYNYYNYYGINFKKLSAANLKKAKKIAKKNDAVTEMKFNNKKAMKSAIENYYSYTSSSKTVMYVEYKEYNVLVIFE